MRVPEEVEVEVEAGGHPPTSHTSNPIPHPPTSNSHTNSNSNFNFNSNSNTPTTLVSSPNRGSIAPVSRTPTEWPKPSNYQRTYSLTEGKPPPPPSNLQVSRDVIPRTQRPNWNSNRDRVDGSPREKLPRIHTQKKTKFYHLYCGKSVSGTPKKENKKKIISGHDTIYWKKTDDSMFKIGILYKNKFIKTLKKMDFKEVLNSKDKDSKILKDAKNLFNTLSKKSEFILPEMLHEHFLICTPPGVAMHEVFDFLNEFCDGKKELNFEDFLNYGEILRERIFAFQKFATLDDNSKLAAISTRVLQNSPPLPTSSSEEELEELWQLLLNALKKQEGEKQKTEENFRRMRLYELLFLVDWQKKTGRIGLKYNSNDSKLFIGDSPLAIKSSNKCNKNVGEEVSWVSSQNKLQNGNNKNKSQKVPVMNGRLGNDEDIKYTIKKYISNSPVRYTRQTSRRNSLGVKEGRKGKKKLSKINDNDLNFALQNVTPDSEASERIIEAREERRRKDDELIRLLEEKYGALNPTETDFIFT